MIFAVADFVCYTFQIGRFHPGRVLQKGGTLAVASNFPDLRDTPAGSLLFCCSRFSPMSWLVMYYTSSIWSHCALFGKKGELFDATTSGVIKHAASDYLDGESYLSVIVLPMDEDTRKRIVAASEELIGCGYNWKGVIRIFLNTLIAKRHKWRLKFSLDIYVILILGLWLQTGANMLWLFLMVFYGVVVAYNLLRRQFNQGQR